MERINWRAFLYRKVLEGVELFKDGIEQAERRIEEKVVA